MQKVRCIHLYNDFSGSPTVLANVINGFVANNFTVTVCTNTTDGKLSNLQGVRYNHFYYKFQKSTILRLLVFAYAQMQLFFNVLFSPKNEIVYINTVLPFGAALAAFVRNKEVVYHIHETSLTPQVFKDFLFGIAKITASKTIYVSKFLAEKEPLNDKCKKVVYNALPNHQAEKLSKITADFNSEKNVLMICSLKDYKGIPEFVKLASQLPAYTFSLVCNATEKEIESYCKGKNMSANLKIFPTQKNVIPFYEAASIVLNLSRNEEWIETFGLTILEAMQAGKPVVGQTVGGTAEILEHGKHGFCIEGKHTEKLKTVITNLLENETEYNFWSEKARERAKYFSLANQQTAIVNFLDQEQMNNSSIEDLKKAV